MDDRFDELLEGEEESVFKKAMVALLGVFLILLMLSWVFVTWPVGDILEGKLESRLVQGDRLEFGEFSLLLRNGTLERLSALYLAEQGQEWSACLRGELMGSEYVVASLYQPRMIERAFDHVRFEPCSADSLVILHSHPYKSCTPSQTDLDLLAASKERNAHVLMAVMCEPDRFAVYR